ncbi:MAG TPA: L-aspartate oxidase [Acidimicrobiales bacterium]|nr:L-aspartate oxidase [Acidimicrobiales bacterium]
MTAAPPTTSIPEIPASLDLLVVGSGVAGLSAAVRAATATGLRVGVLTKGELVQSATRWAQGGIAAVLGGDEDSTDAHLADTLRAGAGLCDIDAVRVLVDEGPGRVNELIALGAEFDRDPDGVLQLAREGGHSHPRVVHAGGAATGAEIERALVEAVRRTAAALLEDWFAVALLVEAGRCCGVVAVDRHGNRREVRATHVLLASGGAGQLFAVTTNPAESTADGWAMALAAGVAVADIEFMQFHPTALHHPAMPRPLLSEALRGHGALIRDIRGERFVDELLPRDQVTRAMTARMVETGVDHCLLDATGLDHFAERFPTIAASLAEVGLDPAVDWLPIAPAAHYLSGGVVTDLDGATALGRLWACGEVACTGVHGANRLASNSLLEGMVFAARVVEAIERGKETPSLTGAMRAVQSAPQPGGAAVIGGRQVAAVSVAFGGAIPVDPDKLRERLQRAMTSDAGVLRDAHSLDEAERELRAVATKTVDPGSVSASPGPEPSPPSQFSPPGELSSPGQFSSPGQITPAVLELANLVRGGLALVAAARARTETRGAHTRTDFPAISDDLRCRLVLR